jgi:hypothetical protein
MPVLTLERAYAEPASIDSTKSTWRAGNRAGAELAGWTQDGVSMTKQEKKRLFTVLRAMEYLFLENIALKLVLEHREVPNWQKLLDRLLDDKEILAGVRLKFRDVYEEIQGSEDPSVALEGLLGELPAPKKEH